MENHDGLSDEEDDSETGTQAPELQGTLYKWTNYIHGWQRRFVVLKDNTLAYYKSEEETEYGCRGAISLLKATIKPHEFDDRRFDVSLNDSVWYLRAKTTEERGHWVEVLEAYKVESGYGSESSLKRHGSAVSITSTTLSSTSTSSFKLGKGLKEKLAELETYKDLLCNQLDVLLKYYEALPENPGALPAPGAIPDKDFKGEAMTFKATSSAIVSALENLMDMFYQREEAWKKRLDKEKQKLLKREEAYQELKKAITVDGPDLEEGPFSKLGDDEFYDAVETGLDRIEEEAAVIREQIRQVTASEASSAGGNPCNHPLWSQIVKVTKEQVHYASLGVGEGAWQLFAEEGDMKLYRREEEIDGLVVDPLKACHIVKGVTGREMCYYFFSPQFRHDWETTLERMTVVETISEDILVFLQVHKRIWPTAQRDALFWSHMTRMSDPNDPDGHDIWAVVNNSTQLPQYPPKSTKCVRVNLTVCLYCHTLVTPPADGTPVSRDDITCKITYCSVVNPGGWVPASALRAVYKREYPKFLKRFTNYVMEKTQNEEIMF